MKKWERVNFELQLWRLPDETVEAFRSGEIDAGQFRHAGRAVGMTEDALDFHIKDIEAKHHDWT